MKKISLLSVSLLVVSSGVLLSSLPMMIEEYKTIPAVWMEFLVTLPALFTLLTVFVSPKIAQMIGYKRTVQVGLFFVLVAGLSPIFLSSFFLLLFSRVLFGVGIGLFHPLLFSFSSSFYKNQELSNMVGFQSAFEGTGGIIVSAAVAYLVGFGWRQTLWVYVIALPILFLFSFFVPDITVKSDEDDVYRSRLELGFWLQMMYLFLLISVYSSISVKLTALVTEIGYGTAKDSSLGLACIGLGSMVAGVIFGKVFSILKGWTATFSIFLFSICILCLSMVKQNWLMLLLTFGIGFSFRSFVPYLLNIANQKKDGSGEHRTTLLLACINIGSAFAPFLIRFLQLLLPIKQVGDLLRFEGIVVMGLALLSVLKLIKSQKI